MTDRRHQIIERLHLVVAGMADFRTAERNRIEFDDTQLPAVSVLDGDDEVSADQIDKRMPSARPYIVTALPQVLIRLGGNSIELNAVRGRVIKAVLEDTQLSGLTLNDGITYRGMQSTFHGARWSDLGFAALVFGFRYIFDPRDS